MTWQGIIKSAAFTVWKPEISVQRTKYKEVETELNLCDVSLHYISATSRWRRIATLAEEEGKLYDEEVQEKHIHESLWFIFNYVHFSLMEVKIVLSVGMNPLQIRLDLSLQVVYDGVFWPVRLSRMKIHGFMYVHITCDETAYII